VSEYGWTWNSEVSWCRSLEAIFSRETRSGLVRSPATGEEMTVVEIDDPDWQRFVTSRSDALPFHHPAWARLVECAYGFRPRALAALDEHAQISAGIPVVEVRDLFRRKKWVSLPFADYSPPLGDAANLKPFFAALDGARSAAGIASVEIRARVNAPGVRTRVRGVRHVLRLTPESDALFVAMRPATRRNVRQGQRSGILVQPCQDQREFVDEFYPMHVRTRRRLGTPVQPRRFFRILWQELIEPGLGSVLLARSQRTPVAGAVFLRWNGTTVYKYGASDPGAWSSRPNNVVMWEAIRMAAESGDHTFDFGRSALNQQGLRAFKAGWGATEVPLEYSFVADAPPNDERIVAPSALSPLIKRSPTWVTRLLGELFYRYAA
jgi:CelD/BcsL family acetyltransferase involved in cellulose biosynthesis